MPEVNNPLIANELGRLRTIVDTLAQNSEYGVDLCYVANSIMKQRSDKNSGTVRLAATGFLYGKEKVFSCTRVLNSVLHYGSLALIKTIGNVNFCPCFWDVRKTKGQC